MHAVKARICADKMIAAHIHFAPQPHAVAQTVCRLRQRFFVFHKAHAIEHNIALGRSIVHIIGLLVLQIDLRLPALLPRNFRLIALNQLLHRLCQIRLGTRKLGIGFAVLAV